MKRLSASLIVASLALMLTACSKDPQSKEQHDAALAFDAAQQKIAQVAAGYIPSDDANLKTTLREYQRQQLTRAFTELAPLTNSGSPGQRVAAALALSSAHASLARFDAADAVRNAAIYSSLSDKAIVLLVTARSNQAAADTGSRINNADSLDTIRRAKNDDQNAQDKIAQDIGSLTSRIQAIDKTDATLTQQRETAMAQAADLRTRAFQSSGQIRFDLYSKANDQSVVSDKLSGRIDLQNVERNKLDALRQIAAIHKDQLQSRIDAAQRAIDQVDAQNQFITKTSKAGSDAATQAAASLLDQIKSLSNDYDQNVVAKFDAARDHLEAAVKALGAVASLDADHVTDVKLQHAARQAELGHLLRQAAVLYQSHASLMNLIADQTKSDFPAQQGEAIRNLAAAAGKAKQTADEAVAALNGADKLLTDAVSSARTPGAKQFALQQQDLVCAAGGQMGDQALGDKVPQIRSQIK